MNLVILIVVPVIVTVVLGEQETEGAPPTYKIECRTGYVTNEHCKLCPCDKTTGLLKTENCRPNVCPDARSRQRAYFSPGCNNTLRTLCTAGQVEESPEGKRCECRNREWFCEEANIKTCPTKRPRGG